LKSKVGLVISGILEIGWGRSAMDGILAPLLLQCNMEIEYSRPARHESNKDVQKQIVT